MTTVPNLNPIPVVTGDDLFIVHETTSNRSGRVLASTVKDFIVNQIIDGGDITAEGIPYDTIDVGQALDDLNTNASTVAGFITAAEKHLRTQKPATYSLPRLFRKLQSYRHDLQTPINIVGFGSSVGVGASLPNPATQAPISRFFSKLKSTVDPGNLYNLIKHNDSVNGSTISESITKLADAVTAGHTPSLCVLTYGMNDGGVAIYNSGQTYPAVYTSILRFVNDARKLGADVVLMTTPHHKTADIVYEMPVGINQVYPTSIASPVGPTQIQPPASQSNITADFNGNGNTITVSHRHLRVNQAMRQAATDAGIPLIDVEKYWFKAIEEFGEEALFDVGEVLHPNLLGHQNSYWPAIDEFLESMAWQTSQEGQEPRLNGSVGINNDLPSSILDIDIPYPETIRDVLNVRARRGIADGNGVKAAAKVLSVENSTGDLCFFGVKTTDNSPVESLRIHTVMDGTGTVVAHSEVRATSNGGAINSRLHTAGYGLNGVVTLATPPNNSAGSIYISARQPGIGVQRLRVDWVVSSDTITLGTISTTGATVVTGPTVSGSNIIVTTVSSGTSVIWQLETNTGL